MPRVAAAAVFLLSAFPFFSAIAGTRRAHEARAAGVLLTAAREPGFAPRYDMAPKRAHRPFRSPRLAFIAAAGPSFVEAPFVPLYFAAPDAEAAPRSIRA